MVVHCVTNSLFRATDKISNMEIMNIFFLCLAGLTICHGLPAKSDGQSKAATNYGNYASDASQIIAVNLLKSYNDIDGNQVHSPLGVAVELAVLAEAANGETYNEFGKVFGYPKERGGLRDSFKRILSKYQRRELADGPSFQTWLYIYRNYSTREEFKQILQDNYFVEVKDINREDYDWSEPNTSLELDANGQTTTASNSKDVVGFETLKRLSVEVDLGDDDDDVAATVAAAAATPKDTYGEEVRQKESSKFDRVVDDKQYVEKPVILEEIKTQQAEQKQQEAVAAEVEKQEIKLEAKEPAVQVSDKIATALDDSNVKTEKELSKREENGDKVAEELNLEENETVLENEKLHQNLEAKLKKEIVPIQELLASNEPEKVSLPLQKLESTKQSSSSKGVEDIMIALESHLSSIRRVFGGRSLFNKDDITSALSANSITGREIGSKTKMLLFNGLYYRGNWANAFHELRDDDDQFFFMTSEDTMKTTMMHTRGSYHVANLEHLNAKALCIPYENPKYTMMIVLPNEIEGLRSLVEKIQPADLAAMESLAKKKDLHVILPKFQVEETSRSEAMLKSLGLQKLFSREEADLSLLSEDADLHVDEIVQFVNIRVDEGESSQGALSAVDTHGRNSATSAEEEKFEVNRPFLYFVMDCEEKFVIVSGKVNAPEFRDDLAPVAIEVEFEQA